MLSRNASLSIQSSASPRSSTETRIPSRLCSRYLQQNHTVFKKLNPPISKESLASLFNFAFSFLRLQAPAAVAEVERQAAEYKLFRSLTLVFLLDLTFTLVVEPRSVARVVIATVLAVGSYLRFAYLLGWTYHLAFEFVYVHFNAAVNEDSSKRRASA